MFDLTIQDPDPVALKTSKFIFSNDVSHPPRSAMNWLSGSELILYALSGPISNTDPKLSTSAGLRIDTQITRPSGTQAMPWYHTATPPPFFYEREGR